MIVDALVPVKAAAAGKERLAQFLSAAARADLVRAMLRDVVGALRAAGALRTVAVTSPDGDMLALADSLGALPIPEPPDQRGLNAALAAAVGRLAAQGAEAVLIVQGDVPEITPADVRGLLAFDGRIEAGQRAIRTAVPSPLVRAVPSADGGTSALLLAPPDVIAPAFGAESFARHRDAAWARGVPFERRDLPALAWDIDRPEDVERLLRAGRAPHTRAVLLQAAGAATSAVTGTSGAPADAARGDRQGFTPTDVARRVAALGVIANPATIWVYLRTRLAAEHPERLADLPPALLPLDEDVLDGWLDDFLDGVEAERARLTRGLHAPRGDGQAADGPSA